VLRRPDSREEFELALGEAMTALQLGNCDLAARAMAAWRARHFATRLRNMGGDGENLPEKSVCFSSVAER
jgi:hypothetical protein